MEIVDGCQNGGRHLFCLEEMMQIRERKMGAGPTGAAMFDGSKAIRVFGFFRLHAPFLSEEEPVSCGSCRIGAVKRIDAEWDARLKRFEIADAEKMVRLLFGQLGH